MRRPASATAKSSPMEVGYMRKEAPRQALVLSSSSLVPRIPPTNSMRLSVFGFSIPRMGPRILSWRMDTSRPDTGSSERNSGRMVRRYQRPSRYRPISPFAAGRGTASGLRIPESAFSQAFSDSGAAVLLSFSGAAVLQAVSVPAQELSPVFPVSGQRTSQIFSTSFRKASGVRPFRSWTTRL